jgi:CRP-like cAMP-binding protein/sugar phosphate isomerase/epimerase
MASSFWEREIWDPVEMILWARKNNLAGLELAIDFHPFNYSKLLPEEFSSEKRQQIKDTSLKCGIKIDIHTPIVGPYSPHPNPDKGKPLFYDPLECIDLQKESIFFARDIGAGSVVVHLIDPSRTEEMSNLVMAAAGSLVRVTIENYCETGERQDAETFISYINEICSLLPNDVVKDNFGVTLDVGHLNIEAVDPLIGAKKIGAWCKKKEIFLRMHATDNYGKLLYYSPHYSADVHGNVSGKGINNSAIIKLLRYIGMNFDVVAEQIQPLTPDDTATIDRAQRFSIKDSYENTVTEGKKKLSGIVIDSLIDFKAKEEEAYQFLVGLENVNSLREYLLQRKIQTKKFLSVEEAKKSSQEFMRMPQSFKLELMEYIDDLLIPVQKEAGLINRSKTDLIYQNISGALFGRVNKENLEQIFYRAKTFNKNDIIFEQNSTGTEMYYVKKGAVIATVDGIDLATLDEGEIFGEMSLFYDIKRVATIKSGINNTTLGILPRNEFEDILANNRRYAYDLIYGLFNILPQRLRNLNGKYKIALTALKQLLENDLERAKRLENIISESKFIKTSLHSLSSEDVETLFPEKKFFDTGEEIFAEGDKGDGAYIILNGKIRVIGFTSDFKEILLGELESGQIFGEMALIDDKPRSASVVTTTPSKVAFMSKKQFNNLVQTKSDLAYRFMSSVCLSIFRHIMRLNAGYLKAKREFQ